MLPFVFPILFPLGLIGLVGLCIAARRRMSRDDNSSKSRAALLMALTRIPAAPEVRSRQENTDA